MRVSIEVGIWQYMARLQLWSGGSGGRRCVHSRDNSGGRRRLRVRNRRGRCRSRPWRGLNKRKGVSEAGDVEGWVWHTSATGEQTPAEVGHGGWSRLSCMHGGSGDAAVDVESQGTRVRPGKCTVPPMAAMSMEREGRTERTRAASCEKVVYSAVLRCGRSGRESMLGRPGSCAPVLAMRRGRRRCWMLGGWAVYTRNGLARLGCLISVVAAAGGGVVDVGVTEARPPA